MAKKQKKNNKGTYPMPNEPNTGNKKTKGKKTKK